VRSARYLTLLQLVCEINCCALRDRRIGAEEKILTFAAGREGDLCVDVTTVSIWDGPLFQDVHRPHTKEDVTCKLTQTRPYVVTGKGQYASLFLLSSELLNANTHDTLYLDLNITIQN
jgi:hypothetical protein